MTAVKTSIGAKDQATGEPFDPTSSIPATNTWDAIQYVLNTALAAATAVQFASDIVGANAARALALADDVFAALRRLRFQVSASHELAKTAQAAAASADARARRTNDVQIALKAQVFN